MRAKRAPSYEYGPFTCGSSDLGGKKAATVVLWQLYAFRGISMLKDAEVLVVVTAAGLPTYVSM